MLARKQARDYGEAASQSDNRQAAARTRRWRAWRGVAAARRRGPAPVHLWNPPFCGDIDMRIAADGTWFYNGSPIGRLPLVQLFASILRRDEDRYVLVTPVERVGIKVDDAPFLAVELIVGDASGAPALAFRTNVEDFVTVDADHPLRFEPGAAGGREALCSGARRLWALVKRALFYDLVGARRVDGDGRARTGSACVSAGCSFR